MLRTGVDIVEISRIGAAVARWGDRFFNRIYTPGELSYSRGRLPQLAGRFAAKEAVMKALGTGVRGVGWREIEVVRKPGEAPTVVLHGRAKARAERCGWGRSHCPFPIPVTTPSWWPWGRPVKIVTPEAMRALERRAVEGSGSLDDLMERAGLLSARAAWDMLQRAGALADRVSAAAAFMSASQVAASPRVLVLVGPGNNGGDGLVAARHLQRWHGAVNVFVLGPRPDDDPKRELALDAGATIIGADEDPVGALERALPTAFIVVDAVLGIGAARPLEGAIRDALALVSAERARRDSLQVLALDVPTGIDAESGEADPNTLSADATVTFGFPKHGHFRFPAAGHAGRLIVADIGVSGELAADIPDDVVTTAWARAALPRRPLDAHKGSFGRVLALAGSPSYVGAAHLACMGAARSGAGTSRWR